MIKVILFLILSSYQPWLTEGAANPGLQLAVTNSGLDYVAKVGIPMLVEQLKTIVIPAISGRFDTPIGHFDYEFSKFVTISRRRNPLTASLYFSIKFESFSIPIYSLTSGSTGLELKTSGISASIHADWHYREESWPHTSDSGSADISASSSSIDLSVILGRDSLHRMTLKATSCTDTIGHLSVDFHGGASWLYNLFDDQIADSIKDTLSDSLCKTAVEYIDTNGNAAVQSIPFISKVDSTAEINYELFSEPLFETTYIQTQHTGEFFAIAKPVEAPCVAPVIPPASTVDDSAMMYIWVSTYVPNTAAFVYQQAGVLKYNITPNSTVLPKGISLSTDFFGGFIPQLSEKYPHRPMKLDLSAGEYPNCSVSDGVISLDVPGMLVAMVYLPNDTVVPVFTLGLVIETTAEVMLTQRNRTEILGFKDTLLNIDLKLLSSEIGTFNVTTLQNTVELIAKYFIIPDINKYGATGIPVPTVEGVSFVDSRITLGTDYIQIATNVIYDPNSYV